MKQTLVTQHFDTLSTEVMRLNLMAQEVQTMLAAQTQLLSMRNLGLPSEVIAEVNVLSELMDNFNTQVEEEITELAQLRALTSTASIINSSLAWDEVIPNAMDLVIGLTGAERGYIMLRDEKTGKYEVTVARNMDKTTIEEDDLAFSQTIIDRVLTTAQPVLSDDVQSDSMFDPSVSMLRFDLRSLMCVPLIYQHEVSGVIYVDNSLQEGTFGKKELRLLAAFANQAAIAIKNAELYERVKAQINEVAEMRQFLDNVFASIGSGVITTDADGYVRTMNSAAEEILEITPENSIGEDIMDVLPAVYEGFENLLNSVLVDGQIETTELNPVLPTRGPSFLMLKLSPLRDASDNTLGIAIVIDDLTQIKRRDETINVIRTYLPMGSDIDSIGSIEGLGLGGEERVISVVSADVRGFTSYSEKLPPEVLLQEINQYLGIAADAIAHNRGIIDKFMGDAIVGLYNTQFNDDENHALNAVRTAYEITQQVHAFHDTLPPPPPGINHLSFGIGVHTDLAMLGNVGSPSRKEFTALGKAVSFSKKLEGIAERYEVIISPATYKLVQDDVEVEAIERSEKAGDKVIQAYLVTNMR